VGAIEAGLATRIGAKITTVTLTPYTARKQRSKHKHLHLNHYGMIQYAFDFGWAIHDRPRHLVFIYQDRAVFGSNFLAVVKATRPGHELFLESFRKIEPKRLRPFLSKRPIVRDHY